MTTLIPKEAKEREIVVDIIRGFALIGVLMANFAAYVYQQAPEHVLNSISSPLDKSLININTIVIEWKFFALFSVLFGYSFGLILESTVRKNINPNAIFTRRMFGLFIAGCVHSLFWYADVLHLYAMSGILLLLFRNKSNRALLFYSLLFLFLIPALILYALRDFPETFTDADMQELYDQLKQGTIAEVFRFNIQFYYRMFIVSGDDLRELIQTLGRFLFGYYLLRIKLFQSVESKIALFRKIALFSSLIMLAYFAIRWLLIKESIHISEFILSPIMAFGILSTSCFYVSALVIAYQFFGMNKFFYVLQNLGKMTLSNYLLVSTFLIILLYGFGFNQLGELPISTIWLYAIIWLFVEIMFSTYWLKRFRYGPAEWILRQLTYWKRLQLRK